MIYDSEFKVYAYETSRGCSWGGCSWGGCTFCSIKHQFGGLFSKEESIWGWKCYPVDRVLEDIHKFAKQGARIFDFKDSEFFGPVRKIRGVDTFKETSERIEAIARGLIEINNSLKEKIIINHISVRTETIYKHGDNDNNKKKKELYTLLKKAGLKGVYLGIESGGPSQLKRYCKGSTVLENKKAIEVFKQIGLDIEVGFIFFDGLATVSELSENITFIEETKLHKSNSRLFGSLRVQNCTPYYKIATREGLVGDCDEGMMIYQCLFKNKDVSKIEKIFTKWEIPTKKLIKLLPYNASSLIYEYDFYFMKDLVTLKNQKLIANIIIKHSINRKKPPSIQRNITPRSSFF